MTSRQLSSINHFALFFLLATLIIGCGLFYKYAIRSPSMPSKKARHAHFMKSRIIEKNRLPKLKSLQREELWAKKLEKKINGEAKEKEVELLFLGDSITRGWIYSPSWKEYYGTRHPLNAGISADRVEHVLFRAQNGLFEHIKPKLVVLLIGINNMGLNKDIEIAGGIRQIIDEIRERTPGTKVLVMGIFPSGERPGTKIRKKIASVNSLINGFRDDRNIFYMDIGDKLTTSKGYISKAIMHDYLHLTNAGYKIYAEAVESKIQDILEEGRQMALKGSHGAYAYNE
ncbi:MAG: hypothetical protein HQK54_03940 [Oligoflexales bacterium]|nr:hypothetical protein [Oligoflexales bacterium]